MSDPASVGLVFTAYGNPRRLDLILRAFRKIEIRPTMIDEILIVEDPSTDTAHDAFRALADREGIRLYTMPEWGCMQGSAQAMMEQSKSDWILYWPDDVLPTPGATEMARMWCMMFSTPEWEHVRVGAFNIPYWNYEELFPGRTREEMFSDTDLAWLEHVRWNPHWFGPSYYVNVNGAGFAIRRKAWEDAGGFSTKTWCLDEHLSCKMWLTTPWTIVTVPGPPTIHGGGLSTPDQHNNNRAHHRHSKLEGWYDEWGMPPAGDKGVLGERCRVRMREEHERTGVYLR